MTGMSKAVFLSYASQDSAAAKCICDALRAGGIEVWFDQSELRGGDAWDRQIRKQIHDCTLFMPVISATTQTRIEGYFRREWKLATERTHDRSERVAFLVPVVIDDTRDADADVPEAFRAVQWTRLLAGQTPPAFAARISQLLSPSESQSTAQARPATGPGPSFHPPTNVAALRRSKFLPLLIAAVALLSIGYFELDKFVLSKRAGTSQAPTPTDQPVAVAKSAIPEKSIAVLPFVDMSEKKDQEYFSDGLSDELIQQLSRIPGLRVPARTSSFYFKGRSDDIATIAGRLRVANVLEGSVRKAGNRLRVTAELIRADNGYHLWSETYDRELKDVFQVQDEIAGAVISALKVELNSPRPVPSPGTSNPGAYNEYLLGRQFYFRGNLDGFKRAVEAYNKAIALDPGYAAAYANLAMAEFFVADELGDKSGFLRAQAAADKAVELDSNQAEPYAVRGFMRRSLSWDWEGAQSDFSKALALEPDNSKVQALYSVLLASLGRWGEAQAAARRAVDIDPLSRPASTALTRVLLCSRDAGAYAAAQRELEIAPESRDALDHLGIQQLLEGKPTQALASFKKINFEVFRLQGIALSEYTLGNQRESQDALDELSSRYGQQFAAEIAEVHAWRGEKDKAFEWLERAYGQHADDLANIKCEPLLDILRSDPRYKALLRKLQLPE